MLEEISNFLQTAIAADKCRVILGNQFDNIDSFDFSRSISEQAISKKSVIVIPDTYHIESISDSAHQLLIQTALCVPILLNKVAIGIIYAYKTDTNAPPFDQNDVQLSIAVSHQAALAIQRSQFIEQAKGFEQLALTDSLTGLDNRRKFIRDAKIEIERATRFNHPLSLMILDIDNFKSINDSFGHLIGDQVLISVARRLESNLRTIDLLARYGGDEFIIVLVEADYEYASTIGKRLLSSITSKPVKTDRGELEISISIGVAAVTKLQSNKSNPLGIADEALYAAKSAGKNQIKIVKVEKI
ncbi:MAG: sensor domain-containing diguanylate cyclase [Chloroflexi bacterium]|nr:sensor domain-containing diguanylate cyclase [Chloroflexota bacterium]